MQTFELARNQLFGLLAVQFCFISREQFVVALDEWEGDRSCVFEEILVKQNTLSEMDLKLLTPLVNRYIDNYGSDPQKCINDFHSIATVIFPSKPLRALQIDEKAPGENGCSDTAQSVGTFE